ncbi:hypothetical protein A2856_00350 [Candidatus Uhrbacteria bacterium RIFCSPHIGHO2_01_FULL_63_20]|uniref:Poly A polymerase head domain-containing protein n=1 Tax=Candidatus Uhrbacteria bacterium RIFCSPHIGHO2_01_FULL_63_20 TaxID=1802385 RepID=A0A1F7TLT5_9BACT|nr:MAG: hypothetical protein A2856_00350 [Candidatus Uhrbacteria bacterium RIFCSPHIGHO2_01_FULL_63_20]
MPYDPSEAISRLRSFLASDPALAFLHAFIADHPGAEAFLVGGAVRDAVMGRSVKDVDVVVRGRAREEVERWLGERGTLELVGKSFGVYKFLPRGFTTDVHPFVDVALPRREHASAGSLGGYRDFDLQVDPQLPIDEDLKRRDFAVNAMAFDIRRERLVDPAHGMDDLHARTIRAVGTPEERFGEDLSRMLRAIRFACQLDFEIEEATWTALKARADELNKKRPDGSFVLPRETVGAELAKAFSARPFAASELLMNSGAMRELLPEVEAAAKGTERYFDPLARVPTGDLAAALAVLMRSVPAKEVAPLIDRVGLATLPKDSPLRTHAANVTWLVERLQQQAVDPTQMRPSQFERQFMNGHGESHLHVLTALGDRERVEKAVARARELRREWGVGEGERVPSLVSGDDVVAAGVAPGPKVRLMLEAARDAQLEGKVKTRTHALKWLREHLGQV